jgi:regulator of RNase E activity RraA
MNAQPLPEVVRDFERVPSDVVEQAGKFQAAILADVAGRRGTLDGRIRALDPSMRMAGPALTVEVRAGDNLMIHAAMALAKPGDVIVVDGKGDRTCALMGAIMMNQCKVLGIAGVVLDAAVRDSLELREWDFRYFRSARIPTAPRSSCRGGSITRSPWAGSRSLQATSSSRMRTASSCWSARRRLPCFRSRRRSSRTRRRG